jgi:hypothetical protein
MEDVSNKDKDFKNISNYNIAQADTEAYECALCFTLMVEPILISCGHLFCLSCIEKLLFNNTFKCPIDRKEFDPEEDLKFCEEIFKKNLENFSEDMKIKAEKIIEERKESIGLCEIKLLYGNYHVLTYKDDPLNSGKHSWKAFAACRTCEESITMIRNKLRAETNLQKLFEGDKKESVKGECGENDLIPDIDFEDNHIIKSVEFKLDPSFNPSSVRVNEAPFHVSCLDWEGFNIGIIVEFHDYLNLEKIELDHFLIFSSTVDIYPKSLHINIDKVKYYINSKC